MSISGIRFACTAAPRFSGKAKLNEPNLVQQALRVASGLLFGVPSSKTSVQVPSPRPESAFMKGLREKGLTPEDDSEMNRVIRDLAQGL
jgi:hypothetical protein